MKKSYKSKKAMQKRRETIFFYALGGLLVLAVVFGVIDLIWGKDSGYTITEDGHVHAADGTHIGTVEEMFGGNVTVSEDGHVHAADGTHIADIDDLVLVASENDHDHAEEDAPESADGENADSSETEAE